MFNVAAQNLQLHACRYNSYNVFFRDEEKYLLSILFIITILQYLLTLKYTSLLIILFQMRVGKNGQIKHFNFLFNNACNQA